MNFFVLLNDFPYIWKFRICTLYYVTEGSGYFLLSLLTDDDLNYLSMTISYTMERIQGNLLVYKLHFYVSAFPVWFFLRMEEAICKKTSACQDYSPEPILHVFSNLCCHAGRSCVPWLSLHRQHASNVQDAS